MDKALELALAHLDKQFGKGTVVRLGDEALQPWPAFSTGAFTLDMALGIGGLPKGRIVELYGAESSGKSTLCLSLVAAAQREGVRCAYIDAENALDPVYMSALGVNLDELLLAQPSSGEEALDITETLIKTGAVGVVIVDSVAALTPRAELEGGMSDQFMGLQPRMMAKALRKLSGPVAETRTLLVFINQLREKVGIVFGSPEVTPGGRALKFYASVRLDLRRTESIKSKADGSVVGIRVKAKIVKNKLAPPLKFGEFDILYGRGINTLGCVVDAALDRGILTSAGSWLKWADTGEVFAQGRDRAVEALASDLELADRLKKQILAA